ncbi:SDR family NAD(P)-dependent oxidoreductase [Streptomyces qinzhouensis]|uniref:SDR family oxidoreductase n=1 Tax=Streptomyces qinzhouensis TaxID=2599401 RepID=A0A5B8J4F2_9ACTN|nr:SDR family oxidoreductase [Streptomyces qinzhouensis]QDY76106.1 SDR family oxidoreductase [Streptomyces qinzhouensis]
MPVAVITGGSKGLGRALALGLAARGWDLVLGARTAAVLAGTAREAEAYGTRVVAVPGDVTDAGHRTELIAAAGRLGGLDLLVSNASVLGAEPLVRLDAHPLAGLRAALEVNVVAALGLVQEALPPLRASAAGTVIVISSEAAAEAYETWGGYGAAKAALDQLAAVLAVEEPGLRVWAVDPGDMDTDLHTAAVPAEGEHRPAPESVVPAFLRLLDERPVSGRYGARSLLVSA